MRAGVPRCARRLRPARPAAPRAGRRRSRSRASRRRRSAGGGSGVGLGRGRDVGGRRGSLSVCVCVRLRLRRSASASVCVGLRRSASVDGVSRHQRTAASMRWGCDGCGVGSGSVRGRFGVGSGLARGRFGRANLRSVCERSAFRALANAMAVFSAWRLRATRSGGADKRYARKRAGRFEGAEKRRRSRTRGRASLLRSRGDRLIRDAAGGDRLEPHGDSVEERHPDESLEVARGA